MNNKNGSKMRGKVVGGEAMTKRAEQGGRRLGKALQLMLIFAMIFCLALGMILSNAFSSIANAASVVPNGTQSVTMNANGITSYFNFTAQQDGFGYINAGSGNSSNGYQGYSYPAGLGRTHNAKAARYYMRGYVDFVVGSDPEKYYLVSPYANVFLYASGNRDAYVFAAARIYASSISQTSAPSQLNYPGDDYRTGLRSMYGGVDNVTWQGTTAVPNNWTMMFMHSAYSGDLYKCFGNHSTGGTGQITGENYMLTGGSTVRLWLALYISTDNQNSATCCAAVCTSLGYTFREIVYNDDYINLPSQVGTVKNTYIQWYGNDHVSGSDDSHREIIMDDFSNIPDGADNPSGGSANTYANWGNYALRAKVFNPNEARKFGSNLKVANGTFPDTTWFNANTKNFTSYGMNVMASNGNPRVAKYRLVIPIYMVTGKLAKIRVSYTVTACLQGVVCSGTTSDSTVGQGYLNVWTRLSTLAPTPDADGASNVGEMWTRSGTNDVITFGSPTSGVSRPSTTFPNGTHASRDITIEFDYRDQAALEAYTGHGKETVLYLALNMEFRKFNSQSGNNDYAGCNFAAFIDNLRVETVETFDGGNGTSASPYLLNSVKAWTSLQAAVSVGKKTYENRYFAMTQSVNFSNGVLYPIGGKNAEYTFKGNLDGRGNSLMNVIIPDGAESNNNNSSTYNESISHNNLGVFGAFAGRGKIQNLNIQNADIRRRENGVSSGSVGDTGHNAENVGALVGRVLGTCEIENCHITGNTSFNASRALGGLVGAVADSGNLTIKNCSNGNKVEITTATEHAGESKTNYVGVGGIVGYASANATLTVDDCTNTGIIQSAWGITAPAGAHQGMYGTGGIVGFSAITTASRLRIYKCDNSSGYIYGAAGDGGIIGYVEQGTVEGCTNSVKVVAATRGDLHNSGSSNIYRGALVGGIVGYGEGVTVSNCYNTGAVSYCAFNSSYTNASSGPPVNEYHTFGCCNIAGGIVGELWGGTVTNCYNSGDVYSWNATGGIVGYGYNVTITYNFVDGTVHNDETGTAYYGTILGRTHSENTNIIYGNWRLDNYNVTSRGVTTYYNFYTNGKSGKKIGAASQHDGFFTLSTGQNRIVNGPAIYTKLADNDYSTQLYQKTEAGDLQAFTWTDIVNYDFNGIAVGAFNTREINGYTLYAKKDSAVYAPEGTYFDQPNPDDASIVSLALIFYTPDAASDNESTYTAHCTPIKIVPNPFSINSSGGTYEWPYRDGSTELLETTIDDIIYVSANNYYVSKDKLAILDDSVTLPERYGKETVYQSMNADGKLENINPVDVVTKYELYYFNFNFTLDGHVVGSLSGTFDILRTRYMISDESNGHIRYTDPIVNNQYMIERNSDDYAIYDAGENEKYAFYFGPIKEYNTTFSNVFGFEQINFDKVIGKLSDAWEFGFYNDNIRRFYSAIESGDFTHGDTPETLRHPGEKIRVLSGSTFRANDLNQQYNISSTDSSYLGASIGSTAIDYPNICYPGIHNRIVKEEGNTAVEVDCSYYYDPSDTKWTKKDEDANEGYYYYVGFEVKDPDETFCVGTDKVDVSRIYFLYQVKPVVIDSVEARWNDGETNHVEKAYDTYNHGLLTLSAKNGTTELSFEDIDKCNKFALTRKISEDGDPETYHINDDTLFMTSTDNSAHFATNSWGSYAFALTLSKTGNYVFGYDDHAMVVDKDDYHYSWSIVPRSLANEEEFKFGYGAGGEVAGDEQLASYAGYYGMFAQGVETSNGSSPSDGEYALMFMDGMDVDGGAHVFSDITKYVLFWEFGNLPDPVGENGYKWIDYSREGIKFSFATSDALLQWDSVTGWSVVEQSDTNTFTTSLEGTEDLKYVYIKFEGDGNFSDAVYVRFALLRHDFGGYKTAQESGKKWGSSDAPYLIVNEAHLIRLSQIVNGAKAWDSIYGDDTLATHPNEMAFATSRDYAGAYFKVFSTATTGSTSETSISANSEHGFDPIGCDEDHPFSGNFDGSRRSIALSIGSDESARYGVVDGQKYKDYVGLFGYVKAAKDPATGTEDANDSTFESAVLKDVNVTGSIYALGNYVGAIAGFAEGARVRGYNTVYAYIDNYFEYITVSSTETVTHGEYTGGAFGKVNGGTIEYSTGSDGNYTAGVIQANSTISGQANYVGGLFGMLEGVKFSVSGSCDQVVVNGAVSGSQYVGGIAGEWVLPNISASQTGGGAGTDNIVPYIDLGVGVTSITGSTYVGGIAGMFNSDRVSALTITPSITQALTISVTNLGGGFIGKLFGLFEGGGYAYSGGENSKGIGTLINVDAADGGVTVNVENVTGTGTVSAIGELFGYVGGAGVLFDGNYTTNLSIVGSAKLHFVGGIAGIIGDNATLEAGSNASGSVSASITNEENITGENFVGGIAGFVTYSAGAQPSDGKNTYLLGNGIDLINKGNITGANFVGGLFGAMGYIDLLLDTFISSVIGTTISYSSDISNILALGNPSLVASPSNLRFGGGTAKTINEGNVEGVNGAYSANFVGGLIGYVGEGSGGKTTQLSLSNAQKPLGSGNEYYNNLSVYVANRNVADATGGGSVLTISGNRYVGGIAGYVGAASHYFSRLFVKADIVSEALLNQSDVNSQTDTYMGGLFGALYGGDVLNSVAVAATDVTAMSAGVRSNGNFVGGLVGEFGGTGSIKSSFTKGFPFEETSFTQNNSTKYVGGISPTRGGLVGALEGSTSVTSSWTFYYAAGATYSTPVSNKIGKFVLIDASLGDPTDIAPQALMAMAGMLTDGSSYSGTDKGVISVNAATAGKVSFKASIPADVAGSARDRQIALYGSNGEKKTWSGNFDVLTNETNPVGDGNFNDVYFRIAASEGSMIVASEEIIYRDMKSSKEGGNNVPISYEEAKRSYYPPANDYGFYTVQEGTTESTITYTYADAPVGGSHTVKHVDGKIYCTRGTGDNKTVVFGYLNRDYTAGSADSPYIISNKDEWDAFASNVKNTPNDQAPYSGEFVKLITDLEIGYSDLAGEKSTSTDAKQGFAGTFDGNGYTITVKIQDCTMMGASVFPYAKEGATFKNLTVAGSIETKGSIGAADNNSATCLAGFVGLPQGNITFLNCTNAANITAGAYAGGLVGRTNGYTVTMVSCTNTGTITSFDKKGTDTGATNKKDYKDGATGGLIGAAEGKTVLESCKNEGTITGGFNVGGLVGAALSLSNPGNSASDKHLEIYNSANTGAVTGNSGYATPSDDYAGVTDNYNFVGGLVGRTDAEHYMTMLSSYNSGNIMAYGNFVGGLVGSLGSMDLNINGEGFESFNEGKPYMLQGGVSRIYYCYNSGSVTAGGKARGTEPTFSQRMSLNGTVAGGIVGAAGGSQVNNCYNLGDITTYGFAKNADDDSASNNKKGRAMVGGIAGIGAAITYSGSDVTKTSFRYCYNVGTLTVDTTHGVTSFLYGGGILGFGNSNDVSNSNCYSTDCKAYTQVSGTTDTIPGTDVTIANLTAVMDVDGSAQLPNIGGKEVVLNGTMANNVKFNASSAATLIDKDGAYRSQFDQSDNSVHYNDDTSATSLKRYMEGNLPGYIFIPGCLPQLAVFALDTKNGLSMHSVAYQTETFDYNGETFIGETAGAQAGDKNNPYIIRDGIELMALSAIVNAPESSDLAAPHHFAGKYIEVADKVGETAVTSIDMSTYKNNVGGGKSYKLYEMAESARTDATWQGNNKYFDGSADASGYDQTRRNFMPIGLGAENYYFAGDFDGNDVAISNLNIVEAGGYAGLFAKVQGSDVMDARIAGVTLSGANVTSYLTDTTKVSATGGVVAWLGGGSAVEGCTLQSSTVTAKIKTEFTPADIENYNTYVGGIVGIVSTARYFADESKYTNTVGDSVYLRGLQVSGATIKGWGTNIGGIAGIATARGGLLADMQTGATVTSTRIELLGLDIDAADGTSTRQKNVVGGTTAIQNVEGTTHHPHAGGGIGGVVGITNGDVTVVVDECEVGTLTDDRVEISGTHRTGGIIGVSYGHTYVGGSAPDAGGGVQVGVGTTIDITTASIDDHGGTAVGGIVGYAVTDTTFVQISFAGTISISGKESVSNIGGMVGYMGTGAGFYSGAEVSITGKISIFTLFHYGQTPTDKHNESIGGLIGYLDGEAVFRGTFDVSPVIGGQDMIDAYAFYVGGFIGFVNGNVYISADPGEETAINIDPKAAKFDATVTGAKYVGGFAGYVGESAGVYVGVIAGSQTACDGEVSINIGNSENTLTIRALDYSDTAFDQKDEDLQLGNDVGGFIGRNNGTLHFEHGKMINNATVNGVNDVGGIVGHNRGALTLGQDMVIENRGDVGISTGTYDYYLDSLTSPSPLSIGNFIGGIIGKFENGTIYGHFANYGNVFGIKYVGGSIGLVGQFDETSGVISANGTIGDARGNYETKFENFGNVKGVQYVGGSIGWMNGQITGNENMYVEFVNGESNDDGTDSGTSGGTGASSSDALVAEGGRADTASTSSGTITSPEGQPANYLGGAIGVLNGNTSYARFANSVSLTIDATNSATSGGSWGIGGSIGIIGTPGNSGLSGSTGSGVTTISVTNSQFEFFRDNNKDPNLKPTVTVTASSDNKSTVDANGVGGAIGIIARGVTFDASNGFFIGGEVRASGSYYVGGAVGLIRAQNAAIEDVLVYYNYVEGKDYVGGIVGSVGWEARGTDGHQDTENDGIGASINNCFNLNGDVVSHGPSANRGGIVGYSVDGTNADTAYWVIDHKAILKDETTGELQTTETEGKKVLDVEPLTSAKIQEIVDKKLWTSGKPGETYNTGSTSKGWYFMYATDGALVMTSETQIDGVHTDKDVADKDAIAGGINRYHDKDQVVRFAYWQAIAGAYTLNQRLGKVEMPTLESFIIGQVIEDDVTNGNAPEQGYIYVAGSAGKEGTYLAVSRSKSGAVSYLHDTKNGTSNPETASGSVPAGGYGYTYIALHVNNEGTNDLGNVAVYYRDIMTDSVVGGVEWKNEWELEEGEKAGVPSVEAVRGSYTGEGNEVVVRSASTTEGDSYYPEFAFNKTYGKYTYIPRITKYTTVGGDEQEISSDENIRNMVASGFYEGYLDICLTDDNGVSKAVGSVPFGLEVAPRELVIQSNPEKGTYTGGDSLGTTVKFGVNDGGSFKDWKDFLEGINAEEIRDVAQQIGDYINSFGIKFAYNKDGNPVDECKEPYDHKKSLSWSGREFGRDATGLAILASHLISRGVYSMHMYPENTYVPMIYKDGAWVEDEAGTTYVATLDGKFYLSGYFGEQPFGDQYDGDQKESDDGTYFDYGFFEIERNKFMIEWQRVDDKNNVYTGAEHTSDEVLTLKAAVPFVDAETLKKELQSQEGNKVEISITSTKDSTGKTYKLSDIIEDITVIDASTARITLKFGPNADTYTASINEDDAVTENATFELQAEGLPNGTYNIYQRLLTPQATDDGKDLQSPYTYNAERQGANRVTFDGIVTGEQGSILAALGMSYTFTYDTQTPDNAYGKQLSSGAVTLTDESLSTNVGKYTLTFELRADSNYTFESNASAPTGRSEATPIEWSIVTYGISISMSGDMRVVYNGAAHRVEVTASAQGTNERIEVTFDPTDGTYTMQPFTNGGSIIFTPTYGGQSDAKPVNAGTYTVTIEDNNISYSNNGDNINYDIQTSGYGSIEILAAVLNVVWADTSITYDGNYHGKSFGQFTLANATNGADIGNLTIGSARYGTLSGATGTATLSVTNCYNTQTETLTLAVSGLEKDAGNNYTAKVDSVSAVSGTNAAGTSIPANYTINSDTSSSEYSISKRQLTGIAISGNTTEKVYDGSRTASTSGITVTFSTLVSGESVPASDYTLTALYNSENVSGQTDGATTITYSVSINSNATVLKNYTLSKNTATANGTITAKTLTVALWLNGSGVATKIYDGDANYGGSGFSGSANGQSNPYRRGNGFTVSGFVSGETDTYNITAVFQETDRNRSNYDAFVNGIGLTAEQTSDKQLVFTLANAASNGPVNYTLKFNDGFDVTERKNTSDTTYTLTNAGKITITKKTIKPTYTFTAQSYANPDNTYNTNWQDVGVQYSSTGIVSKDTSRVRITVSNGWKTDGDGNPKRYTNHTVIRGRESDATLGAQLTATEGLTNAWDELAYLNYTLAQQPTLVIGYFVNSDAFEIGSLASLLIAAYYYSISGQGSDFAVVVPQMVWEPICSDDDYQNNKDTGKWTEAGNECTSWDAYFDYLRGQDIDVFYDEDVTQWGYFKASESTEKPEYTSFKLVKDISGVFTKTDIEILNGMFTITHLGDSTGSTSTQQYDWGFNGDSSKTLVLKNVLKGSVGDTVTILNSLFGNFAGNGEKPAVFDGNGYVIDGFNLMGGIAIGDASDKSYEQNAGLFGTIGTGATVKDLHLRNVNVVANGVQNVGGLAGTISAALDETAGTGVFNVSVHGMFNVTGGTIESDHPVENSIVSTTDVGGIAGKLEGDASIDKAIVLGSIYATDAYVGGAIGSVTDVSGNAKVSNIVSMMYIWSEKDKATALLAGAIYARGSLIPTGCTYLANSVWVNKQNSEFITGYGQSGAVKVEDYSAMYSGSTSGYGNEANAYYSKDATKGELDVLDDVTTEGMAHSGDAEAPAPRQSMRLRDIIDVYLLQYSLSASDVEVDGTKYNIYKKSTSSWLVGTADGTNSNPIVIANQQGVSLLRELRFATFYVAADVYMYSTYKLDTYKGAFFGQIYNTYDATSNYGYDADKGHHIYIKGYTSDKKMFDVVPEPTAGGKKVEFPFKPY